MATAVTDIMPMSRKVYAFKDNNAPMNIFRTTRFTIRPWRLDCFLYKAMFEQFKRKANVYFLIISILQIIPGLSPTGTYNTLGTLICVLIFSIAKQLWEDYRRWLSDCKKNEMESLILDLQNQFWAITQWKNITAGSIIMVESVGGNTELPCSIVVLDTSDSAGISYIETSNLDGENNLKIRRGIGECRIFDHSQLAKCCCEKFKDIYVETGEPSFDLNQFDGRLHIPSTASGGETVCPLTVENLMPAGALLRRTSWVVGIAVFTGTDTSVVNKTIPRKKVSNVEKKMNSLLLIVLGMLLMLCFCCAVGLYVSAPTEWYQEGGDSQNRIVIACFGFLTFLILFNNFIPISLYVTLELIKLFQGWFIEQDLCFYDMAHDRRLGVRSSDLNEELGQVTHIFCDKTGTLTKNKMSFVKFTIGSRIFGETTGNEEGKNADGGDIVDIVPSNSLGNFDDVSCGFFQSGQSFNFSAEEMGDDPRFDFEDISLPGNNFYHLKEAAQIREFFTILSLCHNVVVVEGDFQAETPDEEALVVAAMYFGFKYVGTAKGVSTIELGTAGASQEYDLLHFLPFTPYRKRSSVIVRDANGVISLFCKGADEILRHRIIPSTKNVDADKANETLAHEGLRIILVAKRILSQEAYAEWSQRFLESTNDQAKNEFLMDEIEQNLEFVGSTALKDALQDDVEESVAMLQKSNIKFWVVTGDKKATCMKIAKVVGLIDPNEGSLLVNVDGATYDAVRDGLSQAIPQSSSNWALVLDGSAVTILLANEDLQPSFYTLAKAARTVVCCRTSPQQKAGMVLLLKRMDPNAVPLAIGDGANDIPMIEVSNVGVGMYGEEGNHAVKNADYGISEFRDLQRLTAVHGRVNYVRITKVICYFFYKNILLVMTQFWYTAFNLFSGRSLYEGLTFTLYNVIFTAFPCMVLGAIDRDILSTDRIRQTPQVYLFGQQSLGLNFQNFVRWQVEGVVHATIIFFTVLLGFGNSATSEGHAVDEASIGLTTYMIVILVGTIRLGLEVRSWTMFHWIAWVASIFLGFLFFFVYGEVNGTISGRMYKLAIEVGFKWQMWSFGFLACAFCLIPNTIYRAGEIRLVPFSWLDWVTKIQLADDEDVDASTRQPCELRVDVDSDLFGGVGRRKKGPLRNRLVTMAEKDDKGGAAAVAVGLFRSFPDSSLETNFIKEHVGNLKRYKIGLLVGSLASSIILAFYLLSDQFSETERIAFMVLCACSWLTLIIFQLVPRVSKNYYHEILIVLCIVGFSSIAIANLSSAQEDPTVHPMALAVILLGLTITIQPPVSQAIQYNLIAVVAYYAWYQAFRVRPWKARDISLRFVEVMAVAITATFTLAFVELFMRSAYVAKLQARKVMDQVELEEERSFLLLEEILPKAIVEQVRSNHRTLSEFSVGFPDGSYLQCDIVKFTNFGSKHDPSVVVEMLNRMFTKFDASAALLGVEKIKTIGDAYLCASGVPIPDSRHKQKIVLMGLQILDSVFKLCIEGLTSISNLDIHMRVGVASGPLFVGVVGRQKVAYDVFGQTTAVASLNESSGLPDRVQCTKEIAESCTEHFEFEEIQKDGEVRYFVKGFKPLAAELLQPTKPQATRKTSTYVDPAHGTQPQRGGTSNSLISTSAQSPGIPPSYTHENSKRYDSMEMEVLMPMCRVDPSEEVYRFLDDKDEGRLATIQKWSAFTGEWSKWTLIFDDDEAEEEFKKHLDALSEQRSVVELLIGAGFFLVSGAICTLFFEERQFHPFTWSLYGMSFLHFIFASIKSFVASVDEEHEEQEVVNRKASAFAMDMQTLFQDTLQKSRKVLKTLADHPAGSWLAWSFAFISGAGAFATPIIMLFILDSPETGTIVTFVVLAAVTHIMGFHHLRFPYKVGLGLLHFVILTFGIYWVRGYKRNWEWATYGGDYFALFLCYVLIFFAMRHLEQGVRRNFAAGKTLYGKNAQVASAIHISEKLLNNVFPKSVIRRLRSNPGKQLVDNFPSGSVMFVYMDGDALHLSENSSATDASHNIRAVNDFFFLLDEICLKHRVEKIKTTPYLVVSGVPETCSNHCERLFRTAVEMVHSVASYNENSKSNFSLQIGIHSGAISAGVLGSTKFQYDVFGDTVNMASRLTSSASPGRIHVSQNAKDAAPGYHTMHDLGLLQLKGKGDVQVYQLTSTYAMTQQLGSLKESNKEEVVVEEEELEEEPYRKKVQIVEETVTNEEKVNDEDKM